VASKSDSSKKSLEAIHELHLAQHCQLADETAISSIHKMADAFKSSGCKIQYLTEATTIDGLKASLLAEPTIPLIVLYNRAEDAILEGLAQGTPPAQTLAGWLALTKALMTFQRQYRRSVFLVDKLALFHDPKGFVTALCKLHNLDIGKNVKLRKKNRKYDQLLQLIAAQTVSQSLATRRLAGELDASSLPVGTENEIPQLDVNASFTAYIEGQNDKLTLTEMAQLEQQIKHTEAALKAQIHQAQDQAIHISELEGRLQEITDNQAQGNRNMLASMQERLAHLNSSTRAKNTELLARLDGGKPKAAAEQKEQPQTQLNTRLQAARDSNDALLARVDKLRDALDSTDDQGH